DRRQKLLFLTDDGSAVLDTVAAAVDRTQQRILAPLNPDEQALFIALLERIVDQNNAPSPAPYPDSAKTSPGGSRVERSDPAATGV
ncbi:MarR family winged helix-turn-helix transcriptional regulator, partial [Acinetobacter baumannii]